MDITMLGIDIAKNVFQLFAVDKNGKKVFAKKVARSSLIKTISKLSNSCIIAMEACGGANHWARVFKTMGYEVKLITPQFVKPFVKGNKNDYQDAEAIVEAASRPQMRFVTPKTVAQQDMQSLLRVRAKQIEIRTGLANQLRGLLSEYGIVVKKGCAALRKTLPVLFDRAVDNELSWQIKEILEQQYNLLLIIEEQISYYDIKLNEIAKNNEVCNRLQKIEGIGPITAIAIVASVGDGSAFENGRHFSAFVGLVPRQHSSGGKEKLLGISKRGDNYLRCLLIHGARSVLISAAKKEGARYRWANQVRERRGMNRAAVALANKNARIAMAMILSGEEYKKAA